jgi:hypothetical protein
MDTRLLTTATVILADYQAVARAGVRLLFQHTAPNLKVVAEAACAAAVVTLAERFVPDVLITDLSMPETSDPDPTPGRRARAGSPLPPPDRPSRRRFERTEPVGGRPRSFMSPSQPKTAGICDRHGYRSCGAGAFTRPALPSEPLETQILRRWMGDEWRWVVSEQLLAEHAALLIERGAPEPRVLRAIATIRERSRIVVARPVTQPLPDPGDAHVFV